MQEIRIPEPPKWKLATPHHSDGNADPSTTTPAATHMDDAPTLSIFYRGGWSNQLLLMMDLLLIISSINIIALPRKYLLVILTNHV